MGGEFRGRVQRREMREEGKIKLLILIFYIYVNILQIRYLWYV